ncbi:hypothetical protein GCM10023094_34560 [Rhodococcus olei]|uniref:Haemophore haem-binding domain-containing protein n=1 Tax=Rhodococcus olei TaxID=2161675 RepID=A0ABP8PAY8_9NOCA
MTVFDRPSSFRRANLLAVAIGLCAIATVSTPAVAIADTPDPAVQCSPQARAQAVADSAPKVAAYLNEHPDVAAELAKAASLPRDQRKAELQAFRTAHPQEVKDLAAARSAIHNYRKACHGR